MWVSIAKVSDANNTWKKSNKVIVQLLFVLPLFDIKTAKKKKKIWPSTWSKQIKCSVGVCINTELVLKWKLWLRNILIQSRDQIRVLTEEFFSLTRSLKAPSIPYAELYWGLKTKMVSTLDVASLYLPPRSRLRLCNDATCSLTVFQLKKKNPEG